MTALEIATAMRDALIEIGCVCTEIETSWIDGSSKFVVASGPGRLGRMHTRRIEAGGTLAVTRLS